VIRGLGILIGLALIFAGIGQAVARDWTIDGLFLLLAGLGLAILLLAALSAYETTAGGTPTSPGARLPDA
jgi:hypothetical protein